MGRNVPQAKIAIIVVIWHMMMAVPLAAERALRPEEIAKPTKNAYRPVATTPTTKRTVQIRLSVGAKRMVRNASLVTIATTVVIMPTMMAVPLVAERAIQMEKNASLVRIVICVAPATTIGIRLELCTVVKNNVSQTGHRVFLAKVVRNVAVEGPMTVMAQFVAVNAYQVDLNAITLVHATNVAPMKNSLYLTTPLSSLQYQAQK
jgi:hypothetical protein